MSDISHVAADLDSSAYAHILPSLERAHVTCADILCLDSIDVAKRASIPPAEASRLKDELILALQAGLQLRATNGFPDAGPRCISTLDERLDASLEGGFATGHLSEVTGESAAGKTQLLLALCLAVQLPIPHGLERPALYITTEAVLQTTRLAQILKNNPILASYGDHSRPSLSRIHSIKLPDLETQEHVLQYQVPVMVERMNVGLIVIDSVTANFRAEFDRGDAAGNDSGTAHRKRQSAFATRTRQLVTLGSHLRDLAARFDLAVVVSNQVLDRFSPQTSRTLSSTAADSNGHGSQASARKASQLSSPSTAPARMNMPLVTMAQMDGAADTPSTDEGVELSCPDPLSLDHQQRFVTGWGHMSVAYQQSLPHAGTHALSAHYHSINMKTPSLGQVWTSQLSARIVLLRSPIYQHHDYRLGMREMEVKGWHRWLDVAFSSWCAASVGQLGLPFEIWEGGLKYREYESIKEGTEMG